MMPFSTGGLLSPDGTTLALQTNGATTLDITNGHRHTVLTAAQVKALNHDKLANQVSPLAWYPDGTRLLMIALNQSAHPLLHIFHRPRRPRVPARRPQGLLPNPRHLLRATAVTSRSF